MVMIIAMDLRSYCKGSRKYMLRRYIPNVFKTTVLKGAVKSEFVLLSKNKSSVLTRRKLIKYTGTSSDRLRVASLPGKISCSLGSFVGSISVALSGPRDWHAGSFPETAAGKSSLARSP